MSLFQTLRARGHKIYIYTTSFRPELKVHFTFLSYGVPVDRVINQQRHDKVLKERRTECSKFPPAFGIDIHVDDSPGLAIEGEEFHFRTVILSENDTAWTDKILSIL